MSNSIRTLAIVLLAAAWGCSTDSGGSGAGEPDVGSEAGSLADTAGDSVAGDSVGDGDVGDGDVGGGDVGGGGVGGSDTVTDAGTTSAKWTACSASADCVPVELACCDHCNGGKLGAFHKDHASEAKAALGPAPGACDATACTEMGCGPAVAWCESGVCAAGPDPAFGAGCAKLDETKCKVSPSCAPLSAWAPEASCKNEPATPVFQGCMSGEAGCGDAETCAIEPSTGKLWMFPSTCLPEGWKAQTWEACCPGKGGGGCSAGNATEVGKLCLQPQGGGNGLAVGEAFDVVLWPKGCFSSSCTKVHSKTCSAAIDGDGALVVDAQICIENTASPGQPCTADCSGAGQTTCAAPKLAAGSYTAKYGSLSLAFEVPSKPGAQLCVGSEF